MSSYMVVAGVSEALRHLLWEDLHADPEVGQLFPSEQDIVFTNPTQTAQNTSNRLSLWLYQITENEFMKNQRMVNSGDNSKRITPLAINLSYLITPFTNNADANGSQRDEDHLVLGKILQIFHDNAIILFRDTQNNIAEELRIIFKRLTLEELTRIWEALREPYRLSICYQVQVLRVDSNRAASGTRIVERSSSQQTSLAGAQ